MVTDRPAQHQERACARDVSDTLKILPCGYPRCSAAPPEPDSADLHINTPALASPQRLMPADKQRLMPADKHAPRHTPSWPDITSTVKWMYH